MHLFLSLLVFAVIAGVALLVYAHSFQSEPGQRRKMLRRLGYLGPDLPGAKKNARWSVVWQWYAAFDRRVSALTGLENLISQSGSPIEAWQAILLMLVLFASGLAAGRRWLDWGSSSVLALAAAILPILYLKLKQTRRLGSLSQQLPYLLDLLRSGLESGHSLQRGLQISVQDLPEPIATEIRLVIEQMEVGASLPDALENMFKRVPEESVGLLVSAVRLQSVVGSSLAEIIQHVSEAIRNRQRLEQQIRAVTAQARYSSILVSLLPIAILALFSATRPEYVYPLFHDPRGIRLLKIAVVLNLTALTIMRRICRVKY